MLIRCSGKLVPHRHESGALIFVRTSCVTGSYGVIPPRVMRTASVNVRSAAPDSALTVLLAHS